MSGPYDDIINLPHHVSPTRPQMSMENRAAQFSPFQALTGYHAAIDETARITDERIELGESARDVLDKKITVLADLLDRYPEVTITYFQADQKKDGGKYVSEKSMIKKIDHYANAIILANANRIPFSDILTIECELFNTLL